MFLMKGRSTYRKVMGLISKNPRLMILDTMKVLLSSKQMNGCQGDGYLSVGAQMAPQKSQWLVLRIGGTNSSIVGLLILCS